MQTDIRKELSGVINHLKVYLQETKEEDFWHLKEILVYKTQTDKVRPIKSDFESDPKSASLVKKKKIGKELNKLYEKIKDCKKCTLSKTRINLVFADGDAGRRIMFIGEAPGYDEDRQGLPFVGKAGQLLNEILSSVGLKREEVYITNVVKCHPLLNPEEPEKRGNDRPPTKEEIATCLPILKEQIAIIKPKIICTLGAVATNTLLGTNAPLSKLRGKFYSYGEIELLPTFHPAAILRTPSLKEMFFNDLKKLTTKLET